MCPNAHSIGEAKLSGNQGASVLKYLLLVSLATIVLINAVFLCGCGRSSTNSKADGKGAKSPSPRSSARIQKPEEQGKLRATFRGAEIMWDDERGKPIWRAKFEEATASQTEGGAVVEIKNVEASLFRNGQLVTKLVAPHVVADSRSQKVVADGGVKITSVVYKSSAYASRVVWKSREDKLTASGEVRMQKDNLIINADKLEADTALKKVRFTNAKVNMK